MNLDFYQNASAKLVWDGESLVYPKKPGPTQCSGSTLENLAEVAGRVCYDSFGKGRNTDEFHRHILECRHLNIYEHCILNFRVPTYTQSMQTEVLWSLLNRPGVQVCYFNDYCINLSMNARAAIELLEFQLFSNYPRVPILLSEEVYAALQKHLPLVTKLAEHNFCDQPVQPSEEWECVESTEALWASMFIRCSRNCSHELVRHRWRTAVSQRSTRYCDESQSMFLDHPVLCDEEFWDYMPHAVLERISEKFEDADLAQRALYSEMEYHIYNYLRGRIDDTAAKKQARGAARQFLSSNLQTELLFSASIAQWQRMIRQRITDAADAEIRMLFGKVLGVLQHSRYASYFEEFSTIEAEDGYGVVIGG